MDSEWIRWIGTALLGLIAYEIRGLRRDVQDRVPFSECNWRMDEHSKRLDNLDERVRRHGWEIERMKGEQEENG